MTFLVKTTDVYEITELAGGGWKAVCGGWEEVFPTAHAAQEAVTGREKELADADGVNRASVVCWNATTDVGATVIRAVTGQKEQ